MITIKKRILEMLAHDNWEDKGRIQNEIGYKASCYPDTVGRVLRKLAETGVIEKREYGDKRGTEYRLAHHEPVKIVQYQQPLFNINQITNG